MITPTMTTNKTGVKTMSQINVSLFPYIRLLTLINLFGKRAREPDFHFMHKKTTMDVGPCRPKGALSPERRN